MREIGPMSVPAYDLLREPDLVEIVRLTQREHLLGRFCIKASSAVASAIWTVDAGWLLRLCKMRMDKPWTRRSATPKTWPDAPASSVSAGSPEGGFDRPFLSRPTTGRRLRGRGAMCLRNKLSQLRKE